MLSIATAQALKKAGLKWTPQENDFFFVPFHDLDEKVFVISNMSIAVEALGRDQAITFNGTAEWALDHLIVTDAVWVPTEDQLRRLLENRLLERGENHPLVALLTTSDGYRCEIPLKGEKRAFEAFGAEEAYAAALLFLLGQG